ncbi:MULTISPECIES: hypothetical protein [Luteibacter]|jgi:hypothetical protein|uniref:hypothetical protein n=1 Tax=Luteibacter sp. dw_328 TaxID=2719796 RepID=UPI0007BF548D|nr:MULTISPECIES: hypothetical protein [Luteibacter]
MSTTELNASYDASSLVKAADLKTDVDFDKYMNLLLTISSSATSTSKIVINVGGAAAGYPVIYSLGDEASGSAGMQVSLVTAGSLPLSAITITPNVTTLDTASSGGGGNQWTLQVQGYLAAQAGTQGLLLYAIVTDATTTVQVSLNNGGKTTLSQTPIYFPWKPIN